MLKNLLALGFMIFLLSGTLWARDPVAWVVNGTGETLSKINLNTGAVANNVVAVGSDVLCYPNQIVIRDTMAYVVVSGTDEIQLIDLNSETTVAFIPLSDGFSPFWMAFLDSQYIYVTGFADNSLAKVDVVSRAVVDSWPVGLSPEGILICNQKAYIGITAFDPMTWQFGQGKVVVFDTQGDNLLAELNVGTNPQYLACDTTGLIHVVCTGDYWSAFGMIYVLDPAVDAVIDSFATGGSPGIITIGPDNIAYLAAGGWVSDGYVYSYDATTGELLRGAENPIVVDSGCMMVAAYQDTSAFVGTFKDFVTSIDSAGNELARYPVGDGPVHVAFNYLPGDLDGNFQVDISDLVYLVDYMFVGGPPPRYPRWRGNINGVGGIDVIDIADLVYLVDYMFCQGPPPKIGSTWPG